MAVVRPTHIATRCRRSERQDAVRWRQRLRHDLRHRVRLSARPRDPDVDRLEVLDVLLFNHNQNSPGVIFHERYIHITMAIARRAVMPPK